MISSPLSRQESKQEEEERLVLESNPLEWTVTDVVRFIRLTDCAHLARIFQEQVPPPCLSLSLSFRRAGFLGPGSGRGGAASPSLRSRRWVCGQGTPGPPDTSQGLCAVKQRPKSPLGFPIIPCGAWGHLAWLDIRAPLLAFAALVGRGAGGGFSALSQATFV